MCPTVAHNWQHINASLNYLYNFGQTLIQNKTTSIMHRRKSANTHPPLSPIHVPMDVPLADGGNRVEHVVSQILVKLDVVPPRFVNCAATLGQMCICAPSLVCNHELSITSRTHICAFRLTIRSCQSANDIISSVRNIIIYLHKFFIRLGAGSGYKSECFSKMLICFSLVEILSKVR